MPEEDGLFTQVVMKVFGIERPAAYKGVGLQRPVLPEMESYDKIAVRNDRQTKIKDCQQIAILDPRIYRLLYKLSSDATVGGVTIRVDDALNSSVFNTSQQIIDILLENCDFNYKLKGWTKSCLRDGDLFWEVIVDDIVRRVVRLKKLAAQITFDNMDAEGNYPEDKPAYHQEHPWTKEVIRTFERWQIAHIKWDAEDGQPYGQPMFASARLSYRRLEMGEKNLVVRRGTHAGSKRLHNVGTPDEPTTWEEVQTYKDENQDALDNPMSASSDFFSNGLVSITELQGDLTLGSIEDLEHFEGLVVTPSGVPYAYLGGGRERAINRDVLEEQEKDYYRVIDDVNASIEQGMRQVIRFAMLLQGINEAAVKFSFNWGAHDRDELDTLIERALKYQQLGLSFRTIFETLNLDGVTYEMELDRIQEQVSDGIIPYGNLMKVDPTVLAFIGAMANQTGTQENVVAEKLEALHSTASQMLYGETNDHVALSIREAYDRARDKGILEAKIAP